MSWFKAKAVKGRRVGIGFQPGGVSLVEIDDARGEMLIKCCEFVAADTLQAQGDELVRLAAQHKLKGTSVNVVLDPSMYTLLQVEAPEVEVEEMRAALRWRIKDLIDFHIDDAVLEIFDLPESRRQGLPRLMYVIAARSNLIQGIVDQLDRAGLQINAIDISELSIRNLMATLYGPEDVQALLHLGITHGSIEITQGDLLYLTRRLTLNASSLDGQSGLSLDELLETLVLELQRSLDYYESQFGQGPARGVVVMMPGEYQERLVAYADSNLLVSCRALSLAGQFGGIEQISTDELVRNAPVIGAALRSG